MDWRLKCLAFHTIARVPWAYRFFQRNITHRYFLNLTDHIMWAYGQHAEKFHGGRALEFGAGDNLLCPLLLSHAGATEVIAIDLTRMASVDRVNHVVGQLRERLPGNWPYITDLEGSLEAAYRIRYLAPMDMRATDLAAGSVDFICSTSTLEHIPPGSIAAILEECSRVLAPAGVMSFVVDYHDHYATGDGSITRFNFYRYPDWLWRIYNPAMHFQNRLRHSDYVHLFRAFDVQETRLIPDRPAIDVPLARKFVGYTEEDLVALNGLFQLTRRLHAQ